MAITIATGVKFRFISAAEFATKVAASTLDAGSLYFTGSFVYLATAANTYEEYGGAKVGAAPVNPVDAQPGVFYCDPAVGAVKVAARMQGGTNSGTVQYVNVMDGISNVTVSPDGDLIFTQHDGTEFVMVLPKTTAVNTIMPTDTVLPTERAVVNYVAAQIANVVGGIRYIGALTASTTVTSAQKGDLYRVAEARTFLGSNVVAGDWIVFKQDTATPAAGEFDVFTGVENAAIDNLASTDTALPLSANQGRVLNEHITVVDEKTLDKFTVNPANDGQIVQGAADGTVALSGKSFSVGVLPAAAVAATDRVISEKQAADALVTKADALGAGTADTLLTGNAAGGADGILRTNKTISAAAAIPAAGTASADAVPTEAAVRASLDSIAASAVVNWLVD